MAISVNLLPDIKQERLRTEKRNRKMIVIGLILMAVGIALPVILAITLGTQQVILSNVRNSNEQGIQELEEVEEISQILTSSQQLQSIYDLRDTGQDVFGFLQVLESATPEGVYITTAKILDTGEIEVSGLAPTLKDVDTSVKSLSQFTPSGFVSSRFDITDEPFITGIAVESIDPSDSNGVTFKLIGQFNFELLSELNDSFIQKRDDLFNGADS